MVDVHRSVTTLLVAISVAVGQDILWKVMDMLVMVRWAIIFLPPLPLPPLLPSLPTLFFLLPISLSPSHPPALFSCSLLPLSLPLPPSHPSLHSSLPSSLFLASLPLSLPFCVHLQCSKHYSFLSSDINECVLGTNNCNQNCHNTIGSYYCSCDPGYHLLSHPHICSGILMCSVLCCLY